MSNALLPCPLCGSTDLSLDGSHGEERINCDCGLRLTTPYDADESIAVARWNTRTKFIGARTAFDDWYESVLWGNEDFREGCRRAWQAGTKENDRE